MADPLPNDCQSGGRADARLRSSRGSGPRRGFGLQGLLDSRSKEELVDIFEFWAEGRSLKRPTSKSDLRQRVFDWMTDADRLEERMVSLGRRLSVVLDWLLEQPRYAAAWGELVAAEPFVGMEAVDLEACVLTLQQRGLLTEAPGDDAEGSKSNQAYAARILAVPAELGDGILRIRRQQSDGIFELLTLRGHLERLYADPQRAARTTPQRVREMYKMYAHESAAVARIERLPDGIRGLVEKAILEFGGIFPRSLFERMDTSLPHWNSRRWRMILEESLVGTVRPLDLERFGIKHQDETLVIFNEVALAWLRRVAVPGDPDAPHEELSLGIDLISNLSRFLTYILEHDVRFTVRGEIFKTTEKKIVQHLIPNPGRELSREDVLAFLFRFARRNSLVDSTGERTFAVAPKGREWGERPLSIKLSTLVEYAIEERGHGGDSLHQIPMRRILVRLLKRIEPGTWYDIMYLPFLARNTYLTTLDDIDVENQVAELRRQPGGQGFDDPQRMAWNLVRWLRQRLYLLGVVDLGYDRAARPVAMRLTRSGARLLSVAENAPSFEPHVGSLVVTPDFEVVLFPTGDDVELIHDLDRFCARESLGELLHFRISEESVCRALKDGMYLARVVDTLESYSRTPVPQNVLFSIRDWAKHAGLMTLSADWCISCEDGDTLRRFQQDPGVRPHLETCAEGAVRLKERFTQRRMQALLRELGYLVELVEP